MAESDLIEERESVKSKNQPAYPGTPRWVKLLVIAVVCLILVFVVIHLTGGGMGPEMHMR